MCVLSQINRFECVGSCLCVGEKKKGGRAVIRPLQMNLIEEKDGKIHLQKPNHCTTKPNQECSD